MVHDSIDPPHTVRMVDSKKCRYCRRKFSSSSNRHRHEVYFHHAVKQDDDDDDDTDNGDESMSETKNDKNSDTETSDEEEDQEDQRSDEESDSDDSLDSEEGDNEKHWPEVLRETCQDVSDEIPGADLVFRHPYFETFLEALYTNLTDRMKFAEYMKEKDDVYRKIQKTADICLHKRENNFDEDESFEIAWNDRKYLLKKLLRNHYKVLADELDNDDEDSEGGEEEVESEHENNFAG